MKINTSTATTASDKKEKDYHFDFTLFILIMTINVMRSSGYLPRNVESMKNCRKMLATYSSFVMK